MSKRNITDFFNEEYVNFASYDNYRSIPHVVDGLKPTARKVIYTVLEQNINELKKVDTLKSKVADFTQYLHGEEAIVAVIVGLGQNFVGTNNIPLLKKDGNFGTRLVPAPAAGRYIKSCKISYFTSMFCSDDDPILIEQNFEGEKIEPKYYVPTLPLLLVNGSASALSVAFTSNILPRNIKDIVDRIYLLLEGKEIERFYPWFQGFNGIVTINEKGSVETRGIFTKVGPKEITITELPIGFSLSKYREVLEKLEEKKIIQSWRDESNTRNDTYKFRVKLNKVIPDDKIYDLLKLVNREAENFTCIDENNKIKVFENECEILKKYVEVKLQYYQKRKEYIISELEREIRILRNKLRFLGVVLSGKVVIFKKPRLEIEKQLEENSIERIDDSYDYLLRMQIDQLTEEKVESLIRQFDTKKGELNIIKQKDIKDWWRSDIQKLLEQLKPKRSS